MMDNFVPKEDFVPPYSTSPARVPDGQLAGYARFRVHAPKATSVIASLGLSGQAAPSSAKGEDGYWWGTTAGPMDEGFHYYRLTIRRVQ